MKIAFETLWLHLVIKRLIDILISSMVLILFLPFGIVIALLIKVTSEGPIFFTQIRIGKNGKPFTLFKFRTMIKNAEIIGTGIFTLKDDPRITKIGKLLRKFGLDEIPQLLNVIKGEMSLVGPRPPVIYELGDYNSLDSTTKKRFSFKPGITGYAQVIGRNELSWDAKIELDLQYIEKFKKYGIFFDFYILFLTIIKIFKNEGVYEPPSNLEKDLAKIDKKIMQEYFKKKYGI